jgi:hypothetical protein
MSLTNRDRCGPPGGIVSGSRNYLRDRDGIERTTRAIEDVDRLLERMIADSTRRRLDRGRRCLGGGPSRWPCLNRAG